MVLIEYVCEVPTCKEAYLPRELKSGETAECPECGLFMSAI